jgi:double-stranded uracil-DNA glycosylase
MLHLVGVTPSRFEPSEFALLPEFGIGLTDLCKVDAGSDRRLGKANFDSSRLATSLERATPRHLAFNGKIAARGVLGKDVRYGLQASGFVGIESWVLPLTSGMARRYWNARHWFDLGRAVGSAIRLGSALSDESLRDELGAEEPWAEPPGLPSRTLRWPRNTIAGTSA